MPRTGSATRLAGSPLELDDGQVLFESTAIVLGGVLAVSRFAGVLDAAPANVVDYLDRLQARPAYARARACTESLLVPSTASSSPAATS